MFALPVLPILVALTASLIHCLLWLFPIAKKFFHIGMAVLLLLINSWVFHECLLKHYLVMQVGDYPAPFAISFVIDQFAALMLLVVAILNLSVALYSLNDQDIKLNHITFFPTYWFLIAGVCGALSTGDLFNLYVWFEVMLIASFVLMSIGGHKIQLDGTLKYVVINWVATIVMLVAIAMLYGITGTLNLAQMAVKLAEQPATNVILATASLLVLAFAIKAALFPLNFWLPASYHTPSVTSSAIFSGTLTKVGVYVLCRLFSLLFIKEGFFLHPLLLISATLTMFTGVAGAASQMNFRRILSFHIISQIGYILVGLAIFTPLAIAGAIFFMIHNMFAKASLFLISGIVNRVKGSFDLGQLGGLYKSMPYLSLLFFISAYSLAGFPLLSGFWSKFIVFQSIMTTGHYYILSIALFVSFLTLYSMTKIWKQVFWRPAPKGEITEFPSALENFNMYAAVAILTSMVIFIGLNPAGLFKYTNEISAQLFNPQQYIQAVLEKNQ